MQNSSLLNSSTGAESVTILFNDDSAQDDSEPPPSEAEAEVVDVALEIRSILEAADISVGLVPVRRWDHAEQSHLLATSGRVVFNLVESIARDPRREAEAAEWLDHHQIPYTGNAPNALRLCAAKHLARWRLIAHQLPVPLGFVIEYPDLIPKDLPAGLDYPLFVKPALADASVGISQRSIVHNREQLRARVETVWNDIPGPVLVEEYLPGPELNIAFAPNPWETEGVATAIEFSFPEGFAPIVSYNCKWVEGTPEYAARSVPAHEIAEPAVVDRARRLARAAFLALGATSYGRVDLRVDKRGELRLMDVNPNCDLHPTAGLALAMESVGVPYPALVLSILAGAIARENNASSTYRSTRSRTVGSAITAY